MSFGLSVKKEAMYYCACVNGQGWCKRHEKAWLGSMNVAIILLFVARPTFFGDAEMFGSEEQTICQQ